ncbi:MAG TPA: hypothetical protein VFT74_08855, partial [Isosphaeraceae bacterium]|nr:hypothetical protein [Isosphaeraceae bacterium]
DGEKLDGSLNRLLSELNKVRAADQQHFKGEQWKRWKAVITAIRKNPLDTNVSITEQGPEVDGDAEPASVIDVKHNGAPRETPTDAYAKPIAN